MKKNKSTFIAGHTGMVGSSLYKLLSNSMDGRVVVRSRDLLDLTNQHEVKLFFNDMFLDEVYMLAGLVGGIKANSNFPADFLYQNMMMNANIINTAYESGVKKLLVLGSACMYPLGATQPISEFELMTGAVEPTNEAYAVAKIATVKMAEMYRRQYNFDVRILVPTNMYGPGDCYDLDGSHVIPALLRKFHEAKVNSNKRVEIWGSGYPLRDFLYVDDFAALCVKVMKMDKSEYEGLLGGEPYINVGGGGEISIRELALLVSGAVGYSGEIIFDNSKPDGAKRKSLNAEKLNLMGWAPQTELSKGLIMAYQDFLKII
jgi:GDP-L-fucose synthase